jgi:ribosomal protein S18 acetylase RimI-like enzyme
MEVVLMFELIDKTVIQLQQKGHTLIKIEQARNGNYLILYTPKYHQHNIYAKLVKPDGTISNDHLDLKMFISYDNHKHSYRILNIHIYNDNMNQGYGSILMAHLIETARKNYIIHIEGLMNPASGEYDQRLRHFYRKHGFSIEYRNILWKLNRISIQLRA